MRTFLSQSCSDWKQVKTSLWYWILCLPKLNNVVLYKRYHSKSFMNCFMSCQKENFMYRCVNKLAPVYLCNMFTPRTLLFDLRDYLKRSRASLWNDLPEELRTWKVEPLHSGVKVNILYHNIICLVSIFLMSPLIGFPLSLLGKKF